VRELADGRGANIVLELVGRPELLAEGNGLSTNGGSRVGIGNISRGRTVEIDPSELLRGKKIMGSLMYRPQRLLLTLEALQKQQHQVPYHTIVSHTCPLDQGNRARGESDWHERQAGVSRSMMVL
jgi:Zn-dependent alcohol dehydrogenase